MVCNGQFAEHEIYAHFMSMFLLAVFHWSAHFLGLSFSFSPKLHLLFDLDKMSIASSANESDEELNEVPLAVKMKDPYWQRLVDLAIYKDGNMLPMLMHKLCVFVEDIDVGKISKEALYRLRYLDGELQHVRFLEIARNKRVFPLDNDVMDQKVKFRKL